MAIVWENGVVGHGLLIRKGKKLFANGDVTRAPAANNPVTFGEAPDVIARCRVEIVVRPTGAV
ncbi:hypothetical protein J8F10_26945 [Gemmata sp. G18]|uniref:Uncharacterized protein n=1 Tax=Gemmata palustris TaxID=2822762 RepID=A0ABS5BYT6_9BACT|nr:hypothetical protein [Gemmata palustris]MBP3958899.1 hypothetical protein [Gemmata palustris]